MAVSLDTGICSRLPARILGGCDFSSQLITHVLGCGASGPAKPQNAPCCSQSQPDIWYCEVFVHGDAHDVDRFLAVVFSAWPGLLLCFWRTLAVGTTRRTDIFSLWK
jgi:hypothetical protein